MAVYHMYTEGGADRSFLETVLKHLEIPCNDSEKKDQNIFTLGGWTQIANPVKINQIEMALQDEIPILAILDADHAEDSENFGGKDARLARLKEMLGDLSGHVKIFLFPDHQSDGDLETLLLRIAQPMHREVLNCWDAYARCVTGKVNATTGESYNTPTLKSKVVEFAAAIDETVWDHQGFNKSFTNPEIWNLESPALEPLRQFLLQHLGHLIPQIPKSLNL